MPAPSKETADRSLHDQLIELLRGGNAHLDFAQAIDGLAPAHRGAKAAGSPHTIWQLLEHLRIAQHDILEFSRDPNHKSPKWPDEYWPATERPQDELAWAQTVEQFRRDADAFIRLIDDPQHNLLRPLPHAPEGQSLFREALVLADHNSYHLGQIVLVRKMLESVEAR